MSINAISNLAVARRSDFEPAGTVPKSVSDLAVAAGGPPVPATTQEVAAPLPGSSATNTTLQTLTTYIPTEILTLYVSAVATLGAYTVDGREVGRWIPFFCFFAATPLAVWAAFATKVTSAGRSIPISPRQWPLWEMIAATVAYVAWAFALPNTPFAQFAEWYSPGLAGFLVLVLSWGLGAIAPLMQRPLST